MSREPTDANRIFVGIGEVLFDVFEDGRQALGGAPLNVAVHAHQLAAALGLGEGIRVDVTPIPQQQLHPAGAGDASSAGILLGLALGWEEDRAVDLANRMGAWVASQPPATPMLPASVIDYVRQAMSVRPAV